MNLLEEIIHRAKSDKQRIVLPEGTEKRTLQASEKIINEGVAEVILLGNPEEIKKLITRVKKLGMQLLLRRLL